MGKGLKIIHQDCDASLSEDKTLPYNAFLVEYIEGEATKFDIVSAGKQVDIFDHYYDKYGKDLQNMTQTEGKKGGKNPGKFFFSLRFLNCNTSYKKS